MNSDTNSKLPIDGAVMTPAAVELNYRLPWRLEVDADVDDAFEPGVRYCRIVGPGRFDSIASAWEHPHIYRLIAAAPELLEALRILVGCTEKLPGTHGLALDNARAAIAKAVQP